MVKQRQVQLQHCLMLCDYSYRHTPIYAVVAFRKIRNKSNFAPVRIRTPNTLYPDRPQHDLPSACVIAQFFLQYRLTAFPFSLEKFGVRFKSVFISVSFTLRARSQNNEKRLSRYSCLSVRPSVCPRGTTRFPIGRIFIYLNISVFFENLLIGAIPLCYKI